MLSLILLFLPISELLIFCLFGLNICSAHDTVTTQGEQVDSQRLKISKTTESIRKGPRLDVRKTEAVPV